MKMSYRGVVYDKKNLNPLLETPEAIETGAPATIVSVNAIYPRHVGQTLPQRNSVRQSESLTPAYSEQDHLNLCPTLNFYALSTQPDLTQTPQIHLDNIRRNLQKRIQAAQTAGNAALVNLLEREWQQLSNS